MGGHGLRQHHWYRTTAILGLANPLGGEDAMLNASHYVATETLPNGLRLLIRATEPHDDLAGAIQRKVSPKARDVSLQLKP